jgi:threonine/homoserine/homoserine lactone efflux protein
MTPFVNGLLAGYGIAIPVGAVAILIVNAALLHGFATGFMAGAGAATADLLYAALAVSAGVIVAPVLQPVAPMLRMAGGLVLLVIAVLGVRRGVLQKEVAPGGLPARRASRTYLQFLGLTIINPMTVIYFTALTLGMPQGAAAGRFSSGALFVAGAGLASLSSRIRLAATLIGNLIVFILGARLLASGLLR